MVVLTIFVLVLFIVVGMHIFYPLILTRIARKVENLPRNIDKKALIQSDLPIVTILIPVYNEESVIERRISNIFECTYPMNKLEIIVIDSGSTDKTRTIIHSKFQNTVTLITEKERKGKANAINLALHLSKGDFVILTDGATLYDKETIMHLV